jgi:hypothetical protein
MQQPYCWLLMVGHITREKQNLRPIQFGPVVVIAGIRLLSKMDPHLARAQRDFPDCPDADKLARGSIVGVVDVVDCSTIDRPGIHCVWELRNPRRLKKPKPFTGTGQLIEVEAKLVRGLV